MIQRRNFICTVILIKRNESQKNDWFHQFSGHLYCEDCYGQYLAPDCEKCRKKILGVSKAVKNILACNLAQPQPCFILSY